MAPKTSELDMIFAKLNAVSLAELEQEDDSDAEQLPCRINLIGESMFSDSPHDVSDSDRPCDNDKDGNGNKESNEISQKR